MKSIENQAWDAIESSWLQILKYLGHWSTGVGPLIDILGLTSFFRATTQPSDPATGWQTFSSNIPPDPYKYMKIDEI